jgi:replicative DNA helicase
MIQLQIISKVLNTGSDAIIKDNLLTREYFKGYEDEFDFIENHVEKYGNVPDKATFLDAFDDIELVEVTESDKYLVDAIRELRLFNKSVPVVKKVAELLKTDANAASEYMITAMRELEPDYGLSGVNIVAESEDRLVQYTERKEDENKWFFTTGFPELDDLIHGIQREEELFVIFARTNQGKSWVLEKMCTHIWGLGFNVGYISSEMGATSIGYRFDTLYKNFSNSGLMWGKSDVDEKEYSKYLEELSTSKGKFIVSTPKDFGNIITVSKIKNWIKQYKLDLVAIDGITYISDERAKRYDNKTTTLTDVSEDLMSLSIEMKVPVLVVVQANRSGVAEDDTSGAPELESIRDSDGISHNASKVLSLRQTTDKVLKMEIKKQRFGPVGGKLNYQWEINTGVFSYLPDYTDSQPREKTEKRVQEMKKRISSKDKKDVF